MRRGRKGGREGGCEEGEGGREGAERKNTVNGFCQLHALISN